MADANKIKVIVSDAVGGKIVNAELPCDARVDRLIPALMAKMALPPAQYNIQHKQSGKILKKGDTLASAEIKTGDTLRLVPTMVAG